MNNWVSINFFWLVWFPSLLVFSFSSLSIQFFTSTKQCFSISVSTHNIYYHASSELSKCKFLPQFLWNWWTNNHIRVFKKTLSHMFHGTDDPMTIYGYYRELSCHTRTCKVWCSFFAVNTCKDPTKLSLVWGLLRLTKTSFQNHFIDRYTTIHQYINTLILNL